MAEPIEDKTFIAERLEQDRHRLELLARETKEYYNVVAHFRESVKKHSWRWMSGALLAGYVLSLLLARHGKTSAPCGQEIQPERKLNLGKTCARITNEIWSLARPIIGAYIGREFHKRTTRRKTNSAAEG
jgi:hypothetical protein